MPYIDLQRAFVVRNPCFMNSHKWLPLEMVAIYISVNGAIRETVKEQVFSQRGHYPLIAWLPFSEKKLIQSPLPAGARLVGFDYSPKRASQKDHLN
ncbi:hypothetical protein [Spirosoma koreense]